MSPQRKAHILQRGLLRTPSFSSPHSLFCAVFHCFHGKEFFRGVDVRYTQYAVVLESKFGVPRDILLPMIYTFVRACVHYALFEKEHYLKAQMNMLWALYSMLKEKYAKGIEGATSKNE